MILAPIVLFLSIPPVSKLKNPPVIIEREDGNNQPREFSYAPGQNGWVRLGAVPDILQKAVVLVEDGNFWTHNGIDFFEIQASFKSNRKAGKITRGASTISQQLVKTAFLSHQRSYVRKIREIMGTLYMESILTKQQIFEWYLNVIEYGRGVYGLTNAARYYFGKTADQLNDSEAIYLAVILPNPKRYGAELKAQEISDRLKKRYAWAVYLLFRTGTLTALDKDTLLTYGNIGFPVNEDTINTLKEESDNEDAVEKQVITNFNLPHEEAPTTDQESPSE